MSFLLLAVASLMMMESYNIAIIGADDVGKSSFVQRALDLACPPATNPSSVRMAVDNVTHMVTLFELELEHFELDPCQPIQWPKQVNGHIVPRLDAALVLYDVMSRNSIRELPQMVGMCRSLRHKPRSHNTWRALNWFTEAFRRMADLLKRQLLSPMPGFLQYSARVIATIQKMTGTSTPMSSPTSPFSSLLLTISGFRHTERTFLEPAFTAWYVPQLCTNEVCST